MSEEIKQSEVVQTTESTEAEETQQEEQEESLLNGDVEENTAEKKPDEKLEEKPEVDYSNFELPEGINIDESMLEKAKPLFKELNLSKEQAQKLVSIQAEAIAESNKQQLESWNNTVKQWRNDTIKELGQNYKEELGKANRLIKDFDDESKSFSLLLEESGLANHPSVAKFLINVQKSMSEDKFHQGKQVVKKDFLDSLYPTMSKK